MTTQSSLALLDTDEMKRTIIRVVAVVEAALANDYVQALIADQRLGWTVADVRRVAPARVIFELGELRGNLSAIDDLIAYAAKRKFGSYVGFAPLRRSDVVFPMNVGVLHGASHPRRIRYEARRELKARLGRQSRVVTMVSRLGSQRRFIEWVGEQPGLSTIIRKRTGLTVKGLWRRAKGRAE